MTTQCRPNQGHPPLTTAAQGLGSLSPTIYENSPAKSLATLLESFLVAILVHILLAH